MNTRKIKYSFLCAVMAACLLLSACSGGVTLTNGENGCLDKKNGVNYHYASLCYEPIKIGDSYGNIGGDYELFEIPGADPLRWIAGEDNNILYSDDITLPTLLEMEPHLIRICTTESSGVELCRLTDDAAVLSVAEAFSNGEKLDYPSTAATEKYKVKFASDKYEHMYYTLTYLEYSSDLVIDEVNHGRYFLYNSFDRVFIPIGDEIHKVIEGDLGATTETEADTKAEDTSADVVTEAESNREAVTPV